MTLRDTDHSQTRAFLGQLERGEIKTLGAPVFSPFGGGGASGNNGFGGLLWQPYQAGSKRDYAAEAGDTWRNSAVAACLAWYADNFPEPDMRVVRRTKDGEETVADHPLIRLLRNPNPYYGWHALAKGLVLSYRTNGNAFFYVSKGMIYQPGDPINLWWVPHFRLWPRFDSTGTQYLDGWNYWVGNKTVKLGTDEVIHFRDGIDPYNDRLGACALQSTLREVCTDNQASTYTASILRNMGVPGVIIQPKDARSDFGTPEEREEIAATFMSKTSGENRGKPLVSNEPWQIDQVGMTPEELTLDKIMKIPESRICAAMRLNAMVVGLAVGAEQRTFSNYSEARRAAYEDGIIPMQKEIAYVINRSLMPLLGDPSSENFEFDYSKVQCLSESEDARFKRYGTAFQTDKTITKNEARRGVGLETVPTGDLFADGSPIESVLGDKGDETGATTLGDPAAGAVVQDQALNGAQIASMLTIAQGVAGGLIPQGTARALIFASFPALSIEQVDAIIGPLDGFSPASPKPAPNDKPAVVAEPPVESEDDKAIKSLLAKIERSLELVGLGQ